MGNKRESQPPLPQTTPVPRQRSTIQVSSEKRELRLFLPGNKMERE
jgi:hypothetical protein